MLGKEKKDRLKHICICVYYLCTIKAHGGKWENTFNYAIGVAKTSTCNIIHLKQEISKLRKTL